MTSNRKPSVAKNFAIGGIAGICATSVVQPFDYIKVQIQVRNEGQKGARPSPIAIARETVAKHGFTRLYAGLGPAWLRQATYTTARMGIYKSLMDWSNENRSGPTPLWLKALFSVTAGGLGSIVGNPADLILIRMQSDINLPIEQRRNYTGIINAFSRIISEEGFFSLWRGCTPTIARAMAYNFGMLGPFDQAKETLQRNFGNFTGLVQVSSVISAFFACLFSLPFDNVKTKFQKMAKGPDGQFPYKSFADCFKKSLLKEGVLGLYVGYFTYVFRVAPHVIITLLTTDYLTSKFNS